MHILFNPRCEGLKELLFTHIQISDSSDVSRRTEEQQSPGGCPLNAEYTSQLHET